MKEEIIAVLTGLMNGAERESDRIHAAELLAKLHGLIGPGSTHGQKVSDNVVIMTSLMNGEEEAESE